MPGPGERGNTEGELSVGWRSPTICSFPAAVAYDALAHAEKTWFR